MTEPYPPPGSQPNPQFGPEPGSGPPAGAGVPPPGFQHPPPGYQHPPPGYQHPPPGYQHPPPGYQHPPPGYQHAPPQGQFVLPPGAPPSGYPAPNAFFGAAHKPGAVPLRPLGLGDIYDAAFKIVRHNPKATAGAALLVAVVSMLIPLVIVAIMTLTIDMSLIPSDPAATPTATDFVGIMATYASTVMGVILQALGVIFVTGMVTQVVSVAAIGRKMSLAEAWAATLGCRWRLIGLTAFLSFMASLLLTIYVLISVAISLTAPGEVIVIWFVLSIPLLTCLFLWCWVRFYYLAVPPLMMERVGIFKAIGRGYELTRGNFWRTLGIGLLTAIMVGFVSNILSFPISIAGQLLVLANMDSQYAVLITVITQGITGIIVTTLTAPFTSSVTALQYLDLRMRKEAFDIELMTQAGITAPPR